MKMTGIADSIFNFLFGPLSDVQDMPDLVEFQNSGVTDYFENYQINEIMLRELPVQDTSSPQPAPAYVEPKKATQTKMVSDGFWLRPENSFQAKPKAKEYEPYDPDYPLGFKDSWDDDWDKAYTGDLYPYEEVTFESDNYEMQLPPEMED